MSRFEALAWECAAALVVGGCSAYALHLVVRLVRSACEACHGG